MPHPNPHTATFEVPAEESLRGPSNVAPKHEGHKGHEDHRKAHRIREWRLKTVNVQLESPC